MTLINIAFLTLFSALLATGQILFKKTALSTPNLLSVEGFIALLQNLWFWGALVFYGVATLLWIYLLQTIPLSSAYPFVALGFVIVPLAGWLLFSEALSWPYAAGVALIIAGLAVISLTGSPS